MCPFAFREHVNLTCVSCLQIEEDRRFSSKRPSFPRGIYVARRCSRRMWRIINKFCVPIQIPDALPYFSCVCARNGSSGASNILAHGILTICIHVTKEAHKIETRSSIATIVEITFRVKMSCRKKNSRYKRRVDANASVPSLTAKWHAILTFGEKTLHVFSFNVPLPASNEIALRFSFTGFPSLCKTVIYRLFVCPFTQKLT